MSSKRPLCVVSEQTVEQNVLVGRPWWLQLDGVSNNRMRAEARFFARPFDRKAVWAYRLSLLALPAIMYPLIIWVVQPPYPWLQPTVFTAFYSLLTSTKLGPRRRRQVLGLIPPDPSETVRDTLGEELTPSQTG